MGNTMGKKRKLGSAASAKWVAPEVQAKKDGLSPLGRSYSMPMHNAKPKSDNYHVVALTSSTYGILKVDLPKDADDGRTTMPQNRAVREARPENLSSFTFQEKLRIFDVPEMMVPKPWSEVDQILSKFKAEGEGKAQKAEALNAVKGVKEEEPETINMWELMEGLDEDARSPLPVYAATSPFTPTPPTPKPVLVAKKVRNLETSLSFSAVHTVTEVDADFLEGAVKSELQAAVASDTLITGKCYTQSPSSAPASGPGLGRMNPAGAATAGSVASSRHGSDKENASSSPAVLRQAVLSTLTPVKLNSSENLLQSGIGDSKSNNNNNNSGRVKSPGPISNPFNKVVGPGSEINKTTVKEVKELPFVKVPSGSNFKYNSSLAPSPPLPAESPRGIVGSKSASPQVALPDARSEKKSYASPLGFNTSSSSDDSEGQVHPESPLFDPELLASFEKAIEDVSEDEWYRVRRSDAGAASTSGSSSDGDSPLRAAAAAANSNETLNSTNSAGLESSPLARSKKLETDANSRRMSSKVAPVDFRDVVLQKVHKVDAFEKFEKMCPPGGENRVVIYVTSLRGIRRTFEDCSHMKLVILSYRVAVDERDVSMHADFRQELKDILGKPMPVPRLFIKGRYIGGAEEVSLLHEDGTLGKLLETMPTQTSWEQCDGCGDHRFVPCSECSGSCKVITEDDQVARCSECNENGLVRCPICI